MPTPPDDSTYFSRVLKYLSQYIIPVSIIPITLGVIYGYGAIRENRLEIVHAKNDVERVSKEHNSRILANQITIRSISDKVTGIETSVPLILKGIDDIKATVKSIRKDMGKMDVSIGILKDRENRKIPDSVSCLID